MLIVIAILAALQSAPSLQASGASVQPKSPNVSKPTAHKGKSSQLAANQDVPAPGISNVAYGPPDPPKPPKQPLRPEQAAPIAPRVSFQGGLLTVQAMNSTMSSVLNAIRSRTGIAFEGASPGQERVAVSLGPATPGEVLNSLFLGSRFDYLIIGKDDNPNLVERVILTPRVNVAGGNTRPQPAQQTTEEDSDQDEQPAPDQPAPAPAPVVTAPQAAAPPPQPTTGPKTPEELLQELQQLRQRRQDQQQPPPQQPSSGPPSVQQQPPP